MQLKISAYRDSDPLYAWVKFMWVTPGLPGVALRVWWLDVLKHDATH